MLGGTFMIFHLGSLIISLKYYPLIFDKEYDNDEDVTELRGTKCKWSKKGKRATKVSDLTFMYSGLHKIVLTNWWPTLHYSTIIVDFGKLLFDIGIGVDLDLSHNIFYCIIAHSNGKRRNQKLPFSILIYGIFTKQKELKETNEYLIAPYCKEV